MNKRASEPHRSGPLWWLPLRLRITLWVILVFGVVHVTLSTVVVLFYRQSVQNQIEHDLADAAETLAHNHRATDPTTVFVRAIHDARAAQWGPLALVTCDSSGRPISTAGPYEVTDFKTLAQAVTANANSRIRSDRFLYASAVFDNNDQLVIAAPAENLRQALDPVTFVLLIALPIGIVATGVATWFMSGIAVKPLYQMQSFAKDLSAETVSGDVELDDVSPEIEKLREELQAAMARLGKGYERQARFLANVSHELKTPISVVRTEAEVLLAGNADREELRNFAFSTSEEMHRLGRMIESFLLLTRIRLGTARIKAKRHPINDILMDAVGYCTVMAKQHEVRIAPTLDDSDETSYIEGNADLLETALANLIRNAIRFSPHDARVEVACRIDDQMVAFHVRDYGSGVPEELIDRIFEPFTQADEERRRGRGTGLGLQIAQGIAELHGGRVTVNNLEQGCRFSLNIPLVHHKQPPQTQR